MKLVFLVLLFVLFASAAAAATARKEAVAPSAPPKAKLVGGWSPIKNISDPHVKEIANYAVTEHDRRTGATLKLEKVLWGYTQVVAGINYRLILAANDGSASNIYEAIVWEKSWEHFRNLTSFHQGASCLIIT